MHTTCYEKQKIVESLFADCCDTEAKYQRIIELGKKLPKLSSELKTNDRLVRGCQSKMFLFTTMSADKMRFQAEADALISAGLAHLLIMVYDNESPETVLKCPPAFLDNLNIPASLSPNRANGLYSLHLRMKQEALQLAAQNLGYTQTS